MTETTYRREAPEGFVRDDTRVRLDETGPEVFGWYLMDEDGETLHGIDEVADDAEMEAVWILAERDPRVAIVELWDGHKCLWAALREG